MNKVKGYDLLIEAMIKLDNRFHLTSVGQGEEEYVNKLSESIQYLIDQPLKRENWEKMLKKSLMTLTLKQ